MRLFSAILFLLLCVTIASGSVPLQPEYVRVALHKSVESVKLDGNGLLITDGDGEPLRISPPLQIKRGKEGLLVNGQNVTVLIAVSPAVLQVNGKGYRGKLEIRPADKGLLVVNELPLEDYLVGLINCEISSQWPIEAVKAQAVIARSYAMYQKAARKTSLYQLESSVMDQVYEGSDIEDSRAARGVKETLGEVLTFDAKVIQSFYHSNCGGHTEASENVWGAAIPYLSGVDCKYCLLAPSVKWEQLISLKKLETSLKSGGFPVPGLKEIKCGARNRSGRIKDISLVHGKGTSVVSAVNFRKAVGYTVIRSTNFEVKVVGEDVRFSGSGYGHGVGLCQWGAKQRAGDGFEYREILTYYYPGAKLEKIYGD
jgi:stage II sporulation protein D